MICAMCSVWLSSC
uniref:Uncharacterized protein n=1 Tax=Arundo donax TaxID=35708 RepID=A0A0A9CHA7_ARUDO